MALPCSFDDFCYLSMQLKQSQGRTRVKRGHRAVYLRRWTKQKNIPQNWKASGEVRLTRNCFIFLSKCFESCFILCPSAAFQSIKFNVWKASPTKTSLRIQGRCCKNPPPQVCWKAFCVHKSKSACPETQPNTHSSSGSKPPKNKQLVANQLLVAILSYSQP